MNNVVAMMKQYLAEWKSAQLISTQALYRFVELGDGAKTWVRPSNDEVKITVDAAMFTENSTYGVGLLARDKDDDVLGGKSELYHGDVRPYFAKAIAVRKALSWCKLKAWNKVVIESDCLSVVQAIRSKITMSSPFGQIVMECGQMLQELNIALFLIKRSANKAAHFIARESCSFPFEFWMRGLFLSI